MMRWIAGLSAALLLPACGDGTAADVDGRNPAVPTALGGGQPPIVRIVSPAPRATFQEGGTVTIQAVAADPNAVLARVNFYDGDQLIGGKSAPPFVIAYGGLTAGSHVLTAVAIDIEGITSVSPPVTIFVVRREVEDDEDEDHTDIFVGSPSR
jgi:hypothetical protein